LESRDVLKIEGLRLTRGMRVVLRDVALQARTGELLALMGLSGGGKTTILRCVAGLEPFDAGVVRVDDVTLQPGRSKVPRDLRKHVGMVFQLHYLFEHLSVIDNVTLAPVHVARADRQAAAEKAISLLQSLGVEHPPHSFTRQL
jgi:ABC-type polar amino acid transport system ATPase subunit